MHANTQQPITDFTRRVIAILFMALIPIALLFVLPTQSFAEQQHRIISNRFGMEFVEVPAGSFTMGTSNADRELALKELKSQNEKKYDANSYVDEQPQHEVVISHSYLLGRTEVTQEQWLKVMENRPGPKESWQHQEWQRLPVVNVSWYMAQRFTEELGKMDPDYNYRLPTEAEWEYAARAGKASLRPFPADQLFHRAWYIDSSGDVLHPVGEQPANAFGLYDMLGNVWEWVADWYAPDTYGDGSKRIDPTGPDTGKSRVRRGGSFHCPAVLIRPAYRDANLPETSYSVLGFRVIAIAKDK